LRNLIHKSSVVISAESNGQKLAGQIFVHTKVLLHFEQVHLEKVHLIAGVLAVSKKDHIQFFKVVRLLELLDF